MMDLSQSIYRVRPCEKTTCYTLLSSTKSVRHPLVTRQMLCLRHYFIHASLQHIEPFLEIIRCVESYFYLAVAQAL